MHCLDFFHSTHYDGASAPNFCASCGGTWKYRGRSVSGEEDVEVAPLLDGATEPQGRQQPNATPSGSSSAETDLIIETKTFRTSLRVPLKLRIQDWIFRHITHRREVCIIDAWERELAERVIYGDGQYRLAPGEPETDSHCGIIYKMEREDA